MRIKEKNDIEKFFKETHARYVKNKLVLSQIQGLYIYYDKYLLIDCRDVIITSTCLRFSRNLVYKRYYKVGIITSTALKYLDTF